MITKERVLKFITDYFIIFGILMFGTVLFTPDTNINKQYIQLAMTFAWVGDLPSLVFWSRKELTESQQRLRMLLHFVLLETAVLLFATYAKIVSGFPAYVGFALQIGVIYLLVRLVAYRNDVSTATRINEKLKDFNRSDD